MNKLKSSSKQFKKIRNLFLAGALQSVLNEAEEYISGFAKNVRYVGPVRAKAERYYRRQGLTIDEVDSQGENLVMVLEGFSENEKADFRKWTNAALGFEVRSHRETGNLTMLLTEKGGKNEFNLADTGFGFSQIIPLIAQLWLLMVRDRRPSRELPICLIIEQPELHLHPSLQAKVADILISTINFAHSNDIDLRIIIETHSEAIINRLGYMILKKELSDDIVNIIIFEKNDPNKPTKISKASFKPDGTLENWPYGFFLP